MKNLEELSFQKLTVEEMNDIQGGWKLFGKEAKAIEGTSCQHSVAGCTQQWEETRYVFGIKLKPKIKLSGCSNMENLRGGNSSGCAGCTGCWFNLLANRLFIYF